MRTLSRYRQDLVHRSMRSIHHLQKTLRRMNICLEDVLSDGVGAESVLLFLSEVGTNVDKFPSAGHFKSWLGLAPNHRISGGKILSRHTKRSSNRLTVALRQGASTVKSKKGHSQLKHLFHRVASRSSKSTAVVATAGKIATTMWYCVKNRCAYQELSEEDYQLQHRQKHLF